jgi:BirA family transcriptional regulator, biotin operon repressor / biotin---[acetyl-CoA-carboxylase] ligase
VESPDVAILRALFSAGEGFISGTHIAGQLGLTRAAVWKRMEQLEALGYPILSQPHQGYRLGHPLPDLLIADEIKARLASSPPPALSWYPIVFKETASTNDLVWREAIHNYPEGLVITADSQTQGRGRQGRVWQSPASLGLYASVLLRPPWPITQAARLTIITSLAIAQALENISGTRLQIKWPNDLFYQGKKLGGILTEVQGDLESIRFAVVGFGLNLHHQANDFPPELRDQATSLSLLSGRPYRRIDVLLKVLAELQLAYQRPFAEVRAAWAERCFTLGQLLAVQTPRGLLQGQAMNVDADGALLLRLESGRIERITSGDVFPVAQPAQGVRGKN